MRMCCGIGYVNEYDEFPINRILFIRTNIKPNTIRLLRKEMKMNEHPAQFDKQDEQHTQNRFQSVKLSEFHNPKLW